ncbi:MAG: hypothetical protein A2309_03285 [Bacteroidetes bacterium RIFOXYB2_FULL_35_7]|nr:MAG: hypothetical protein A2309_03285 [Bacteroidetes bacterium RIFOXYB2_FULL_35_7]
MKPPLRAFLIILLTSLILLFFSIFIEPLNLFFFKENSFRLCFSDIPALLGFKPSAEYSEKHDTTGSLSEDSLIKILSGTYKHAWPDDSVKIHALVLSYVKNNLSEDTLQNIQKIEAFVNNNIKSDSSVAAKFIKNLLLSYFNASDDKAILNPLIGSSRPLDAFFYALLKEADTSLIRVAHYGDSQLEGGRLSVNIRKKFQQKFGGNGVGFVPFIETVSNVALSHFDMDGWQRYTVFHDRYCNSFYGASGNVYRWSPCAKNNGDSLSSDTLKEEKYALGLNFSPWAKWEKVSLMYGRSMGDCYVSVFDEKNNLVTSDTLYPAPSFALQDIDIPATVKKMRFEFSSNVVFDFYGFLFDGKKGVQVDNYGIRGHSGDSLLHISRKYFAEQLQQLKTKLIILQFGANAVPYVNNENECKEIEENFFRILQRCKEVAPDASILLIGTGDMATRLKGEWQSFPILPKFREAQKNAAIRAGCAYWNLGTVMGGENAILEWTKQKFASNDGHFTPNGQEEVATRLFDALMLEYEKYCNEKNSARK